MNSNELASITSKLYYGEYIGADSVIEFIDWLENDCITEHEEYTQ